jgi:hypothetical protein
MKVFMRLSRLLSIAFAGFLYISAAHVAVAAQAPRPLVAAMERSSHSSIMQAYYYYRGRRYPYRYHGMYFMHRRYSAGRWHYY